MKEYSIEELLAAKKEGGCAMSMTDRIILKGMKQNNLKNVTLEIPKNKITIFTGVSGSGKSSIVFDTIANEAGRQMNQTYSAFVQGFYRNTKSPMSKVLRIYHRLLLSIKSV